VAVVHSELYGLSALDPDAVADRIGEAAGWPVERHTSVYLGDYAVCIASPGPDRVLSRARVRVCRNNDPLYRPGVHPPEDQFLWPRYACYPILVEAALDGANLSRLRQILRADFPDAVLLESAELL
jgi:hypothetical protein